MQTCFKCADAQESAIAVELLKHLCLQAVSDPTLAAANGITHCNVAVQRIAMGKGCVDFNSAMLANDMIDRVTTMWQPAKELDATNHALHGGLAMAGKKDMPHGHIAVVYPSPMQMSASYLRMVPMLANIGEINKVGRASEFFRHDHQPDYFLWPN